jgi:hypothetical protein
VFPQPSQKSHRRSHRARRKGWETFPKAATYCHLLPFRSRKTATSVSTVPFHSLPFEGVPASLGPGLRTVSGAVRTDCSSDVLPGPLSAAGDTLESNATSNETNGPNAHGETLTNEPNDAREIVTNDAAADYQRERNVLNRIKSRIKIKSRIASNALRPTVDGEIGTNESTEARKHDERTYRGPRNRGERSHARRRRRARKPDLHESARAEFDDRTGARRSG